MFVHAVYFWLKPALSTEQLSIFEQGMQSLRDIDTVQSAFIGTPASTDRPVIDRTYSYGLILTFVDKEAHDRYQDHPTHQAFVQNCSSFWVAVKIYDFVE